MSSPASWALTTTLLAVSILAICNTLWPQRQYRTELVPGPAHSTGTVDFYAGHADPTRGDPTNSKKLESEFASIGKRLTRKVEALKSSTFAGLTQIEKTLSEQIDRLHSSVEAVASVSDEQDGRLEPAEQRDPAAAFSVSNSSHDNSWTDLQIQHTELEEWGEALRHQMAMLCLSAASPLAGDAAAAAAAERRCAARITRRARRYLRSHTVGGPAAAAAAAARHAPNSMRLAAIRRRKAVIQVLPMKQYKPIAIDQASALPYPSLPSTWVKLGVAFYGLIAGYNHGHTSP